MVIKKGTAQYKRFFKALSEGLTVRGAALKAGYNDQTIYSKMRVDVSFKMEIDIAKKESRDKEIASLLAVINSPKSKAGEIQVAYCKLTTLKYTVTDEDIKAE